MTIVLEKYRSDDGTRADIQQEKYSTLYQLDVFRLIDNGPFTQTVHRGNYMTRSSARRAMKRFGTGWEKEED